MVLKIPSEVDVGPVEFDPSDVRVGDEDVIFIIDIDDNFSGV